ncbi:phenylacetate--CoA ligase family protein [Mesonia sp. MT50]|uniref:Phenylacetate--CoA ligase family protein n=1 Tax=Mesonia profundi TaxID=3070998 RepID=A0ABU1A3H7_9FLAO|nr:phenylacetate--CoA ligase family protein [Mesonia profundi]MDQ7918275.1 phenylacetate--CoA ligase family protein [Mesonia profundi]
MILKSIYKIGTKQRNPSLDSYYRFLEKTDFWSKEKLLDYQLKKCKSLLEFADKHSEFYRKVFKENKFEPSSFNSLDVLKKIPSISKRDLIENKSSIQSNFVFKKLIHSESSGTSGQALSFLKNEEWDSHNRAAMFRGYSWYEVKPWDKNGYLWGYNINPKKALKIKLLDKLQNRFRLFSYSDNDIKEFAVNLKGAKYLHGYSSMIYEIAKTINSLNLKVSHNLKMIKGTSEKVYDSYQPEVQKAFGLKIINEYGAAESGLIAFECPQGNMHIAMENVIVEEENGEILVTNLLSKSFPIIRYKLGDSIELEDSNFKCICGRSHPVIKNVLGRVGKMVIGKNSKYPSLSFYYVFKNLAMEHNVVLNYQAVQHKPGTIVLNIEQNKPATKSFVEQELKKYFKDDVEFEINFGVSLHSKEGKLKDFITTID